MQATSRRMPDAVPHNAAEISACEKSQQAGEALEGLQAMQATSRRMPDVITHNAAEISACENNQRPEKLWRDYRRCRRGRVTGNAGEVPRARRDHPQRRRVSACEKVSA